MSSARSGSDSDASEPRHATWNWLLFLRQRRLMAQLGKLQNDFKHCYCQADCNGSLHVEEGVPVVPGPRPRLHVHAPFVRVDSDLPRTWARPEYHRDADDVVVAEARGTSDILLPRDGHRATLRMSLQVRRKASQAPLVGYFGEMFLTRWGQPEEFLGFIQSFHVDRRSNAAWEVTYLGEWADGQYGGTGDFLQRIYNITFKGNKRDNAPYEYHNPENVAVEERTEDAMLLPTDPYRDHFASAWARISEDGADILYIPLIWIRNKFQGQRIIARGFELLFRLMTGGTLSGAYNLNRPLAVLLQAGMLSPPYDGGWLDANGDEMDWIPQLDAIARGYMRGGFMRLVQDKDSLDYYMGRGVDPADYPAAPGDMAIVPPNPPPSDVSTPSPMRARPVGTGHRGPKFLPGRKTPVSPTFWRGNNAGSVANNNSSSNGDNGDNDGNDGSSNDNDNDQEMAQGI
ncbi:hypothetical protein KVR01_012763 [Diaporthe batatas]|uniref:uncharacterized protein n=1 Tax=Diaporthe batatas TaxID=748121 RepID=UPI001D0597DF|nr:uncharacterized protein KVR01_012763 [Diaporthe batatas]KAG8157379.1 hypothetical protein KVR01_012763 [Diaporthe batatas]